jgi:hypothetical protein
MVNAGGKTGGPGRPNSSGANDTKAKRAPRAADKVAQATGMDARTLAKAEAVMLVARSPICLRNLDLDAFPQMPRSRLKSRKMLPPCLAGEGLFLGSTQTRGIISVWPMQWAGAGNSHHIRARPLQLEQAQQEAGPVGH